MNIKTVILDETNDAETVAADYAEKNGYSLCESSEPITADEQGTISCEVTKYDKGNERVSDPFRITITLDLLRRKCYHSVTYKGNGEYDCENEREWDTLTQEEKKSLLDKVFATDADLSDWDIVGI